MDDMNSVVTRREFLKMAGAAGAAAAVLAAASRWPARSEASSAVGESKHAWAMVIDQAKCIGCGYCTLACRATNDVPPDISWNTVEQVGEIGGQPVYQPRPCMHCEHPPCAEVCPVKATYRRGDGLVVMDYDRCIGCRYCQVACPYGARSFNWKKFEGPNPAVPEWGEPEVPRRPRGVVEKCSFCIQRIDRGLEHGLTPGVHPAATPACVNACPVGARVFGDLNDPESTVSRLLAENHPYRLRDEMGNEPRVYYLSKREETK